MAYRLSIKLGSTYIAWCLLDVEPEGVCGVQNLGLRIFPDGREPKTKEPLATVRHDARRTRRRRDRFKSRQRRLIDFLVEHDLMPANETARKALELKDPYELRAKALDEQLSLHELGRTLFHINQRRGFKSNRKIDPLDPETSVMKKGIAELESLLRSSDSRTLGEYLAKRHRARKAVRARRNIQQSEGAYEFFPSRAMCEQEIDLILRSQRAFYPGLLDEIGERLKEIILFLRPMRFPPPGKCILEPGHNRARMAYPALQSWRIFKQVSALEVDAPTDMNPPLTEAERQQIIDRLHETRQLTFAAVRKLLGRRMAPTFNFEMGTTRKELLGNLTAYYLSGEACFGDSWHELSEHQQNAAVDLILEEADPEKALGVLVKDYGLSPEQAEKALDAPLDEHRARVSLTAAHNILPHLQSGCRYSEACRKAGYGDPRSSGGKALQRLPYYGEILPQVTAGGTYDPEDRANPEAYFGRLARDPSLHIVLNQLRKLTNAIIEQHGPPEEICVHVAAELGDPRLTQARQRRSAYRKEQTNEKLRQYGIAPTSEARLRFRLWQGHALPGDTWQARTVRDYLACVAPCRDAGVSDDLIALLRMKWGLDALTRELVREKLESLLPTSLSANRRRLHLLDWLQNDDSTESHGLPFQQAADAFIIGCATPGQFYAIARESAGMFIDPRLREDPQISAQTLPGPFTGYTGQLRDLLEGLVVSYKPDHGNARKAISSPRPRTTAKLHLETAYGFVAQREDQPTALYVTRKPIDAFTTLAKIEAVADPAWREKMLAAVQDLPDGSAKFKQALAAFAATHVVRRLRVHSVRSPETMIPVYHPDDKGKPEARPYKHYPRGGNYCTEIYCLDDDQDSGDWALEVISIHHAHQRDFMPQWRKDHPTARLIMRLHLNDMVAYKEDGATRICRVKALTPSLVYVLDHRLGNLPKAESDRMIRMLSPLQMQKFNMRKISVDILGRVRDPLGVISYQRAA